MLKVKVFTDGGARGNPGPAASGVVIEGLAGNERVICGKYLGTTTNNVAEYQAVVLALEKLEKLTKPEETEVAFFMDSLLVARQLSGQYKVKNGNLAQIVTKIRSLTKDYLQVTYNHIPREQNKLADQEVNRVLDQL